MGNNATRDCGIIEMEIFRERIIPMTTKNVNRQEGYKSINGGGEGPQQHVTKKSNNARLESSRYRYNEQ